MRSSGLEALRIPRDGREDPQDDAEHELEEAQGAERDHAEQDAAHLQRSRFHLSVEQAEDCLEDLSAAHHHQDGDGEVDDESAYRQKAKLGPPGLL